MKVTDVPGIGQATAKKLAKARIKTVQDLAHADVDDTSRDAGVPKKKIAEWQEKAVALVAKGRPGGASGASLEGAAHNVRNALEEARVVLREKAHTARIKIGDRIIQELPIITARLHENEQKILDRVRQDAVLLKEKAETAVVKLNGKVHENLPLFKEKLSEASEGADAAVREIRVRVQEIRERRRAEEPPTPQAAVGGDDVDAPKKKGFFSKMLRR